MTYSIAMTEGVNKQFIAHLIREDHQEDLCFAFYNNSSGFDRTTAIISEVILPLKGDRNIHGNVSFNSQFLDRVSEVALKKQCGICFIHSHPSKGWQGMSQDDIETEQMLSPRVKAITGLPLVGMTIGNDGYWSGRFWIKVAPKTYQREYCESIRVLGNSFKPYYNNKLLPEQSLKGHFIRTVSAWGLSKQSDIARMKVGIVGIGSVGSIVAEALVKTGVQNITLIDFDTIENKNLDRLSGSMVDFIGYHKVDAYKTTLEKMSPDKSVKINAVPYSIIEKKGFLSALDCDILFSCVDRPWPRYILDNIAYSHLIPVIDGGIDAKINRKGTNLDYARWKAHIVAPGRRCMMCLGQYKPEDVALEQSGLLDDQNYISGLSREHFINRGENVFGFSVGLASIEVNMFLSYVLKPRGQYVGPKEFDFNSGTIDADFDYSCDTNCSIYDLLGTGNRNNSILISEHSIAEINRTEARTRIEKLTPRNIFMEFWKKLAAIW